MAYECYVQMTEQSVLIHIYLIDCSPHTSSELTLSSLSGPQIQATTPSTSHCTRLLATQTPTSICNQCPERLTLGILLPPQLSHNEDSPPRIPPHNILTNIGAQIHRQHPPPLSPPSTISPPPLFPVQFLSLTFWHSQLATKPAHPANSNATTTAMISIKTPQNPASLVRCIEPQLQSTKTEPVEATPWRWRCGMRQLVAFSSYPI